MNLYLHQVEPHITIGDSIYDVRCGVPYEWLTEGESQVRPGSNRHIPQYNGTSPIHRTLSLVPSLDVGEAA